MSLRNVNEIILTASLMFWLNIGNLNKKHIAEQKFLVRNSRILIHTKSG